MLTLHVFVRILPLIVAGHWAGAAFGQSYPSKAIRIITLPPGGGADFVSRLIAQGISPALGQPVIVDNRAAGVVPGETVSKAAPDGYTLLVSGSSLWLLPFLQDNVPYDPIRDLAPISMIVSAPTVLAVHPSLPVKSVKELIALAKANPGALNCASSAAGSAPFLAAELFRSMAGVNFVRIPYKGGGPAIADLIAGHVQMSFATAGSVTAHVKSGRLRAVAVTSLEPSALAPGLPTVAASGLPGYESVSIQGLFAPSKTPDAIIGRLHQETARYVRTAEAKERFLNTGVEGVGSSPEQAAATVKSEMTRLGKLIKESSIRSQ